MKKTVLSSGGVIVRKVNEKWEFLILRSFSYWDFPKGVNNPGEDPWEGALREIQEETGLKNLTDSWKKSFYETRPYGKGKVARYYILEANPDQQVALLPNPENGIVEHHEYRWLPYHSVRLLLNPRIQEVLDWANETINLFIKE